MSRIEKALEKASLMRRGEGEEVARPSRTTSAGNLLHLLDVEPLKVSNPFLTVSGKVDRSICEEYNKLQSLIVSFAHGTTFRNTLLITSSVSEEGKTLTALNLAFALARGYDHSVLLVDADLRRPSVHRYLGLTPEVGLIQYLKDDIPLPRALIKTGIGKLVVLPAGGSVEDPVELLSSHRMKDLVEELKHRYPERIILFDSPPAMGFADAQVMTDLVDGTLFVVREGRVHRAQLKKTLEYFKHKNLVGAIMNDASNLVRTGYGYY